MTQQNIQLFVTQNSNMFESHQLQQIIELLKTEDDEKIVILSSANYKNPTTMLIISLFFGGLGIDRFMLGEIGIGILKLLTGGCFGILTIIDWFTVVNKTKQKNFELFMEINNNQNLIFDTKPSSKIEEIKKLQELLEAGIISEEEFELKKKEILWKMLKTIYTL